MAIDEKPGVLDEPDLVVTPDARPPADPPLCASPSKPVDITTQVLRFLSTASRETLGGVMAGLAGCTYLILGRLGLVLIGVVGGVVLHATWEQGQTGADGADERRRREMGIAVASRVLDWRERVAGEQEEEPEKSLDASALTFDDFPPETSAALTALVDAVIRDYVEFWYHPMLPRERLFPLDCRRTLTSFLLNISNRLSRLRPADKFLDFLTNSSSIIIVFLNELSNAIASSENDVPALEAVQHYLNMNPDSNLATILTRKQQKRKFHMVADDILDHFIDKDVRNCAPAKSFLREVLAGVVLEMTLTRCSKAEWINGWIVYLLEEGEPEINHAIDMGMAAGRAEDLDGNIGNVSIAKPEPPRPKDDHPTHKKQMSKVIEEETMEEVKRLTQMMMEEDARRARASQELLQPSAPDLLDELRTHPPDVFKRQASFNPELQETAAQGNPTPPASIESPTPEENISPRQFTNFDQLIPLTPLPDAATPKAIPPLTFHNAKFMVTDESRDTDKGRFRSKPTVDYWISVEPASSLHAGWMINRKYVEFEELHEFLTTQARVLQITGFVEQHSALPSWRTHSKASLRGELERYLNESCWYRELAESERMKRFLAKSQEQMSIGGKAGLGVWPGGLENVGRGVLGAITGAPRGAAEGSKVVLEGVTGVFTNIGRGQKIHTGPNPSQTALPRLNSMQSNGVPHSPQQGRQSEESLAPSPVIQNQPGKIAPMERRPSHTSAAETEGESPRVGRNSISARSSISGRGSASQSRDPSRAPAKATPISSPTRPAEEMVPPDTEYGEFSPRSSHGHTESIVHTSRTSMSIDSPRASSSLPKRSSSISRTRQPRPRKEAAPLSSDETAVAIDLLFAVVTELYKLSSAWTIRRSLLNAAKTFLLKNGNQSLTSIQRLIQETVIAANTTDSGIASHLRTLRQNALPTEEELKAWPAELTAEEKSKLRDKARKLLLERGMPAALTGVMGQAATNESMGRLFDCLQNEEIARGLIFGLLLQGVRAVTQ